MDPFDGFQATKTRATTVPSAFFTDLLPAIDNLAELKITLCYLASGSPGGHEPAPAAGGFPGRSKIM